MEFAPIKALICGGACALLFCVSVAVMETSQWRLKLRKVWRQYCEETDEDDDKPDEKDNDNNNESDNEHSKKDDDNKEIQEQIKKQDDNGTASQTY